MAKGKQGIDPLFPAATSLVAYGQPTVRCQRRRCWRGTPYGEGPDLGLGRMRCSPRPAVRGGVTWLVVLIYEGPVERHTLELELPSRY
jgi:hypothetical protein